MQSLLMLMAPLVSAAANDFEKPAVFAAPIPIAEPAAGPIAKLLYPTPVLQDVDGDGAVEMILGDLPGNLWVCERLDGDGPMDWSEPEPLSVDGRPLKFNNW